MIISIKQYLEGKNHRLVFANALNKYCSDEDYKTMNCSEVIEVFEKEDSTKKSRMNFLCDSIFHNQIFWTNINDMKTYILMGNDEARFNHATRIISAVFNESNNHSLCVDFPIFKLLNELSTEQLSCISDKILSDTIILRRFLIVLTFVDNENLKYINPDIISRIIDKKEMCTNNIINNYFNAEKERMNEMKNSTINELEEKNSKLVEFITNLKQSLDDQIEITNGIKTHFDQYMTISGQNGIDIINSQLKKHFITHREIINTNKHNQIDELRKTIEKMTSDHDRTLSQLADAYKLMGNAKKNHVNEIAQIDELRKTIEKMTSDHDRTLSQLADAYKLMGNAKKNHVNEIAQIRKEFEEYKEQINEDQSIEALKI